VASSGTIVPSISLGKSLHASKANLVPASLARPSQLGALPVETANQTRTSLFQTQCTALEVEYIFSPGTDFVFPIISYCRSLGLLNLFNGVEHSCSLKTAEKEKKLREKAHLYWTKSV
jgi:hypothetical protein